jgi:hypothetical protein
MFIGASPGLAEAEHGSALWRAILALVMPTRKRHLARGRLPLLMSTTIHGAKLTEADQPT